MGRAVNIDPNRLFAAADALLSATRSRECLNSLIPMCVDSPISDGRESPGAFTRIELSEAMAMLIRMGFAGPGGGVR